ncbi:hypothetical protein, partial [Microbacterium sp. CCH5-D1]|uniref:hypothetical protein n=1 Tax=Microbacterium sp. CCH5-D1 TaxID=1768780 RepID=UPI000A4EF580
TDPYLADEPTGPVDDVAPSAAADTDVAPAPAPAAPPTPAPAAAPAARRGTFRASVAVLHTDGVWLPDGSRVDLEEPIVHAGQIALLA